MKTFNYRYMLKRAVPMFALAGAGLMIGCEKESPAEPTPDNDVDVPAPNPYDGPMDSIKVFTYTREEANSIRGDSVMKYANDPRVIKIIYFLDSTNFNNDFRNRSGSELHNERVFLERCINYAPTKAVGAGTYVIRPGEIYADDSLWIINHGWKIKSSEHYYDWLQSK